MFLKTLNTVFTRKNGDKLLIYQDSEHPRIVQYFLESKMMGDCQNISEYEAQCILHEEGFFHFPKLLQSGPINLLEKSLFEI